MRIDIPLPQFKNHSCICVHQLRTNKSKERCFNKDGRLHSIELFKTLRGSLKIKVKRRFFDVLDFTAVYTTRINSVKNFIF